jgi:tetrahydromethanopterin S-methyltransferase subunit G
LYNEVHQLQKKLDKLDKHIDFIDKTYDGLKGPISMATRFFGRR